ncbi:hypothetical protein NB545_10070 [Vibrio campbellii]|uniref:hypothetical protein n=1 Tax=Vibrio campbellii TaxID=680 RepID=UPI001B834A51|nr:hypothetical protein [Vibrio campbellii]MCR9907805.1 hypothetical protein [Vibrio campbellii]HBC3421835.1 hypothetical protein [Vibrio parahaemolyticus]HBC3883637.1 hypothetical protein [Vibrio parahaemolyticus]HBC3907928.1 hypothetical protein [Vibrio parahaemolyticus]
MIRFQLDSFLELLDFFYNHSNEQEQFSRLVTLDDMKKAGISTTKENKVKETFVFHFQLLQTEQLICTLKNEKSQFDNSIHSSKCKVCFGLTPKGEMFCRALFEKGAAQFLRELGSEVTFSVCIQAVISFDSDLIFH